MNNISILILQYYRKNINIQPANGRAGKNKLEVQNEK